ncbi:MAG: hypothetical protein HRU13_02610 [Phycisphaerales bacterium]|nr:hypothetical protein [Phycisphaerales bacterium]
MPATLTIRDEGLGTAEGQGVDTYELTVPDERLTIRELIRERVYQEVDDHNRRVRAGEDNRFRGLVRPHDVEASLNSAASREKRMPRQIDWQVQFDLATKAFEDRRVLVLVGEKQATDLDEAFTISPGMEVTFLRLVPLVGG